MLLHGAELVGGYAGGPQSTLGQAAEAALLDEQLFGAGQVTSYADAQLARCLLGNCQKLLARCDRACGKLART